MSTPVPAPDAPGPDPSGPGVPGPAAAPDAAAGWVRVHPASPWVKGWTVVAAFLFVVGRDVVERTVGSMVGAPDGGGPDGPPLPGTLTGVGVVAAVLVVPCLAFFFSWWFTRFRLGPEQIELRQGWLFRSRRQMPYDRIQAVDLQHPLVARLLGLAAVKVEAADGGESALELAYLRTGHAARVRREILDRASGAALGPSGEPVRAEDVPGDGTPGPATAGDAAPAARVHPRRDRVLAHLSGPEDEGEVMLRVPAGRLVASVLLSDTVVGTVVGLLAAAGGLLGIAAVVPGAVEEGQEGGFLGILLSMTLPAVFAVGGSVWSGLNRGWGFTVRRSSDGLRLRHGLTETTSQTVPPGRVQGVEVVQPLVWRLFGWHRVKVSVAGYGGELGESRDVALPVGPWEDVLRVLAVVAPDPGLDGDPRAAGRDPGQAAAALMRQAMTGAGEEGGFRHVPRRARAWFHWFTWRRHGYTLTRTLLVVRSGWLRRRVQAVQHERLQTAVLSQGPVQRRLDVARLTVHLAGGTARVDDLDAADLRALFEAEARHAAVSRRLADRVHWMLPEERERFDRRTAEVAATATGRRELAAAGVVVGGVGPGERQDGQDRGEGRP